MGPARSRRAGGRLALQQLPLLLLGRAAGHRGLLTRPSCDDDFGSSATALPLAQLATDGI
jgi:hypothetical protein